VSAALAQAGATVGSAAAAGGFDRPDAHLTRTELRLDRQAWEELASELEAVLARAEELEREAAERLGEDRTPDETVAGLVVMLFEAARAAAKVEEPPPLRRNSRRRVAS
jgi:hypothetical protein